MFLCNGKKISSMFYNVGVAFDLKLGASWNFVGFSGFYSEVRLAGM